MKIFLSGPMTNIDKYNFPEFNRKAEMLRSRGWEVVNPVDICLKYKFEKVISDKTVFNAMVKEELEQLVTCDAIYMMKGWENSLGAMKEYVLARRHNLKFVFEQNGLIRRTIRAIRDWAFEW